MIFTSAGVRRLLACVCLILIPLQISAGQNGDTTDKTSKTAESEKAASAGREDHKDDTAISKLNTELTAQLQKELQQVPELRADDVEAVELFSRRGDLFMFLGKFAEAEKDYQQMVVLQPELDSSHWRLGIAMYFAGHPEQAAKQFDKYHSFDNVDRENGIWRYLSHRAAYGKEQARRQLLKYEKDDRPPFREVYQLFEGRMSASDVLSAIPDNAGKQDTRSRLFYSHLYIGLNSAVEGDRTSALHALRQATLNDWPRNAGFGPAYMWHIGRLQYLQIIEQSKTEQNKTEQNKTEQNKTEQPASPK